MYHVFDTVTNGDKALSGFRVVVRSSPGGPIVPIFADNVGTPIISVSGIANTAITDAVGNYDFFIPEGTYTLEYQTPAGVFSKSIPDVPMLGGPKGDKGDAGDPGGNVMSTGPFAALPAQEVPTGANVIVTNDGGTSFAAPSYTDADVASQPRFIAKTSNGRYFRRDEAFVDLRQVGLQYADRSNPSAFSSAAANNTGAFMEALAYLKRFGVANGPTLRGTPRLRLPADRFPLGRINLKQATIIEGDGFGLEGGYGTLIDFTSTGGFTVERSDTLNGALVATSTGGADAAILRNFSANGGSSPTGREANPCIDLKARATVEQVFIEGFAGAGVRAIVNAVGSGQERGNANVSTISGVTTYGCFDGFLLRNIDSNAIKLLGCNANFSASCGFADFSFLGNAHWGHHTAANGLGIAGTSVMVSYAGQRFAPIFGRDAFWSTTPPDQLATDGQRAWAYFEDGGPIPNIPTWVSGGNYMFGAAYAATDRNARSVFEACYTEGTQAPPQVRWPSLAIGGLFFNVGDGMWLTGEQGAVNASAFRAGATMLENGGLKLGGPGVADFRLKPFTNGRVRADFNNSDGAMPFMVHGPTTTDPRGVGLEVIDRLLVPGGGAVGGFVNAQPTVNLPYPSIVYNGNRTAATAPLGWSNIPGTTTWLPFGAQAA